MKKRAISAEAFGPFGLMKEITKVNGFLEIERASKAGTFRFPQQEMSLFCPE